MGFLNRPIDTLASKMAFFPPDPPMYDLMEQQNAEGETVLVACAPKKKIALARRCDIFTLKTKHGSDIVACYLTTKNHSDPVLLYSHGNAVDLGCMLPFYECWTPSQEDIASRELCKELKCNIMSFDYSGYGRSTGTSSISNSQNDVTACLEWLFAAGKQASDVVVYGQSIGSGPSVYLAAKQKDIAGLILHSPLASGMQVLNPGWGWWPSFLDIFPNTQLMPKIQCPVLVMHGKLDDVIPISHGEKLHSLAKKPSAPFWLANGDHQNLECSPLYLGRLKEFMKEVFGSEQK